MPGSHEGAPGTLYENTLLACVVAGISARSAEVKALFSPL